MPRRLRHRLFAILCLLLALAGAARADPEGYALDPVHPHVLDAFEHVGLLNALGTLSVYSAKQRLDPDGWGSAHVEVDIPVARLDFGEEQWNRATLARNLLDAETHPDAGFASNRIEPIDERHAIVHGTLTLRG